MGGSPSESVSLVDLSLRGRGMSLSLAGEIQSRSGRDTGGLSILSARERFVVVRGRGISSVVEGARFCDIVMG